MNTLWQARLNHALQQQKQHLRWRSRIPFEQQGSRYLQYEQQTYLNFSSNDYLGLSSYYHTALDKTRQRGYGNGVSSPLITGHSRAHEALEQQLAQHTGYPRALLFSSGYCANLALLGTLATRHDTIIHDDNNHASLLDGGILSRARHIRYRHRDMGHLQERLTDRSTEHALVVSDSLFSMDGDLAPMTELVNLCEQQQALLIIDDAHGFGVLGERGQGIRAHCQLKAEHIPVYMGTLSKAVGGVGAFVAGSDTLIDYLIQFARPYIYSTSLPTVWVEATVQALHRLQQGDLQQRLQANISYFITQLHNTGLPMIASQTAIQPVLVGTNQCALDMSLWLRNHGIWLTAIRPPTVAEHQARLRITLNAAHQQEDIDTLINALQQAWSLYGQHA